jgi:hypothetical protein
MALTQKRLVGPVQLTASAATYYTVGSGVTSIVKQIVLTNTTGSAKTATVRLVPTGQSTGVSYDILSAVTLAANETVSFNCSLVMTAGDFISALASAGTSVNITVSGIEES